MSLPPSFELCGCPLPSVNGKYLLSENRLSYTHANASYGLRQTDGGFWAVVETRTGMQVGKSSVPSNVPPRFGWEYYNLKEQVLKPAKSMQCMTDGDEPVDTEPFEEEDDDPANYDPVLLAESFDTLLDPGRPVPTLPAIEHGAHVNVCSFYVTSMRGKKVEVFVPLSGASELGKEVVRRSHLSSFEEIEPFWVSTVATYEHKIATETAEYATREADLRSTIDKLRGGAQESNRREQLLRQHSNTLKLQHKAQYVKRDAYLNQAPPTSSSNGSDFPHGETIRNEFSTVYLQFETFATDAVNCLQQHMGQTEPATAFTLHVMLPIFETTRRFVEERLEAKRALLKSGFGVTLDDASAEESAVKAFWLHSQQAQLGAEIALLREDVINSMIGSMGPLLAELEVIMHKAALVGEIAAGEQTLRIPKLIRTFLRFHMVALLSEPRCYLHPAPCERVHHKEGYSTEILSPGAKTHGRIKEGAEVEVMLPGLYFDAPGGAAKPVFPCLVRRLTVL